jgi:hypothetical protein
MLVSRLSGQYLIPSSSAVTHSNLHSHLHSNQPQFTLSTINFLKNPFFSKPSPTFTMKAVFVTLLSLAASAFASPVASRDVTVEQVEKTMTITTLTQQVKTYTSSISMSSSRLLEHPSPSPPDEP